MEMKFRIVVEMHKAIMVLRDTIPKPETDHLAADRK
jgi:hypothetical protein